MRRWRAWLSVVLLALAGLCFAQDGAMGRNPFYGRADGLSLPGPTRGPKIWGIDISKWQGTVDFAQVKTAVSFIVMRSDYGTSRDERYLYNRAAAEAQGIAIGFYHYAYPQYHSATEEADYFSTNVAPLKPGQFVVLDFEEAWSGDKVAWCKTWLDRVKSRLGIKPLIYINLSTARSLDWSSVIAGDYGLWLARWDYDKDAEAPSTPWPFVAMRQYSDRETVPGISGRVDGDVFYGTLDDLLKYGAGIGVGERGAVPQHFIDCYNRNGGKAAVGSPLDYVAWRWSPTRAEVQEFGGGSLGPARIIDNQGASAVNPACLVYGPVWTAYDGLGGPNSALGQPVLDLAAVPGGMQLDCQSGRVYLKSGSSAAFAVAGAFFTKHLGLGGTTGVLGWPLAPSFNSGQSPQGTAGAAQTFEGGTLYSSAKGTWMVSGAVKSEHDRLGGTTSTLGYPTADYSAAGTSPFGTSGSRQPFEGGGVYATASFGSWGVYGGLYAAYGSASGPTGPWGYPMGAAQIVGGHLQQQFEGGLMSTADVGATAVHLTARVVSAGATAQIELTVTNTGAGTARGVTVTGIQFGAAKATADWTVGDLAAGTSAKKTVPFDAGFGARKASLVTGNVSAGGTVARRRFKLARP
ncbi:MAG: hypothetical protein KF857_05220 [Fimbriimonadaceae bacterium]|nr:hypothetical protein [Fimbriimonadaceae bacterium]